MDLCLVIPNSTSQLFANSQLVSFPPAGIFKWNCPQKWNKIFFFFYILSLLGLSGVTFPVSCSVAWHWVRQVNHRTETVAWFNDLYSAIGLFTVMRWKLKREIITFKQRNQTKNTPQKERFTRWLTYVWSGLGGCKFSSKTSPINPPKEMSPRKY